MFGSFFMNSETKAVNDFSIAVERKDIGNITKLVKKYNCLLELRNEQNIPYLFIVLQFMDTIQFINLIHNTSIDISKITNMHNNNIILYAIENNKDVAHYFIENLAKYNLNVNHTNNDGCTALHSAVFRNQIEMIKLLLVQPTVNINQPANDGCTALHSAVFRNQIEMIKVLLVQPTVNINQQANDGCTALHSAVFNNQIEIIQVLLIQPTININQQTNEGWTSLHTAIYFHHKEIFNFLLNNQNININLQNNKGESPLHFAVYDNHTEYAKLLLENKNIDITIINRDNKTAYHYAVENKSYEIANLIKLKEENDVQIKKLNKIEPPVAIEDNTDLNSIQIENSIKTQEKEIRALKIKLKIKKREEELGEIWTIQQKEQAEIENIGFELQTLSNSITQKEKEIADIKETIKTKEGIYNHLIKVKIDTSEKENEIAKLKESLNHLTDLPPENIDNECPICFHLMHNKKIYQCSQGHYYCETCKANTQICPYCREDISKSEIRNRYIEQLLAKKHTNE